MTICSRSSNGRVVDSRYSGKGGRVDGVEADNGVDKGREERDVGVEGETAAVAIASGVGAALANDQALESVVASRRMGRQISNVSQHPNQAGTRLYRRPIGCLGIFTLQPNASLTD